MTERMIEVPGGRLAVHDFGAGPPVVLLHAGIVDSWAWEPLTPFLLDAGYRVVAFDRRGTGASMTEDVPYSNRADTVAVLDALGLGQAVLVGNSVGGQVATDTAIEFPGRVSALVTIGSIVPTWWPGMTEEEEAVEAELERVAEAGDPAAIAAADVRAWVDGPGQPPDRVPHDIRELVREMGQAIQEAAIARGDPGVPVPLEPPASEQLGRLTMPVLAVCGELDFSYHRKSAEYLAANVADGRAAVMPGVAHLPGLEAPEELGKLIVDFLSPLPRWS
jgi:pimeloyl-ACP methyl ester carboxylesterase